MMKIEYFFLYDGQLVACGKRYLYKFHLIIQGFEDNLIVVIESNAE